MFDYHCAERLRGLPAAPGRPCLSALFSLRALQRLGPGVTRGGDGGTEGRRDGGTEGRRDGGTEGRRDGGTEGRRDGGTELRTLTPTASGYYF
ncbi:hypothetical protein EYF80_064462 [Liparis tanakae]|uniref:Uncharacterized protein n=1 Tax=Liparis tanakae TaxID=230148 RepID=A0A4Z2EA35_9TELE|nr:hypothetical protein EYF80_064462 [Liparis tanakae]